MSEKYFWHHIHLLFDSLSNVIKILHLTRWLFTVILKNDPRIRNIFCIFLFKVFKWYFYLLSSIHRCNNTFSFLLSMFILSMSLYTYIYQTTLEFTHEMMIIYFQKQLRQSFWRFEPIFHKCTFHQEWKEIERSSKR